MLKLTIFVLAILAANCLQLHTQAKVYKLYKYGIRTPPTVRLQDGNLYIEQCPQCSLPYQVNNYMQTVTMGEYTCPEEAICQNYDYDHVFRQLHSTAYYHQNDEGVIYAYDRFQELIAILSPA